MVNRCDSVDALMYAYYEMMRIKEENQMLEKNKDYIEMRVSSTDCAFTQNAATTISIEGFSYDISFRLPDPGESYVIVSKEKFEKLQKDNQHYREMAKQWEENHNLLLQKTGFDTVESLVFYLTNIGKCDTLLGAIASLRDRAKYTCDEWKDMKKKLEECEKDYISERDKAEALQTENEQLKKKLEEFSPDLPGYREFLTALYPEADVEKMVWVTKHIFGCRSQQDVLQTDLEYYRTISSAQAKSIYCWKEVTGCPTPEAAKTLIESGMSYEYAYHEGQKENRKLTEEVNSWKNVTGYSTPEDYMHARISGAFHTPFDYTSVWQKATGCDTPEQAKERIKALNERIDESEADYNHLLCTTGFESEGEIEDALDKCDHSTLRKALVDYEFDYEELLKLTGYKSNQDIRVTLNYSEQFVYETLRELINSLKRKAKFTESSWQKATGRISPEAAKQYIDRLKGRLNKIHGYSVDW